MIGLPASPRVLIAASGTGGHLFPALHIAMAILEECPEAAVEFVGSGRPLEEKLIDGAGYKRHVVKIGGVKNRGLRAARELLTRYPAAIVKIWRLFTTSRPDVVIGVGGYVSVLPVIVARMRGIPSWIHEAELKPGLANHVLCYFATRVSTAFKEAKLPRVARSVFTGHPVRKELAQLERTHPENGVPRRILVTGGSQGGRGIDLGMAALAPFLKSHNVEITHQCREENKELLEAAYGAAGVPARVMIFIDDMIAEYRRADIIVSRSGAGMVMELGIVNKPVIFVPFPFAQGDHQTANAKTLVNHGKALLVPEGDDFAERLRGALEKLLDPAEYKRMRELTFPNRSADAANQIARGALGLISSR